MSRAASRSGIFAMLPRQPPAVVPPAPGQSEAGRTGHAGAAPQRRVFIDCCAVDFARQPTGIPRVVGKYIEIGYAWGARRGTEVIPVLVSGEGFVLVRPVPGKAAPADLMSRELASHAAGQSGFYGRARLLRDYLSNVVHHAMCFAAALVPVPPVKSAGTWIDGLLADMTRASDRLLDRLARSAILFEPRPGDVLFAPAYWHDVDPAVYRGLRERGVEIVVLVHDLLPIVFEHFYPSPWRYAFRDNVRAAFGYASAFFCVSSFTRAALREFGQRNKLDPVPTMTAYNGFEPLVSDAAAAEIRGATQTPIMGSDKFYQTIRMQPLLMVGSIEPKKGHIPVIQCMEAAWQAGYQRPLLIIGRPGWMEQDIVAAIRNSFFFDKRMFWCSDADDYDLAAAYIFCHALIFSSLAEGFGIPTIEAAYYGKPTIALDTAVVREVLGDKALFFDSAAGFMEHLLDLEDPAKYDAACRIAESVRWPLWEDYAPRTFDRLIDFVAGAELPEIVAPFDAEGSRPPAAGVAFARPEADRRSRRKRL